jgi:hypothetical protein
MLLRERQQISHIGCCKVDHFSLKLTLLWVYLQRYLYVAVRVVSDGARFARQACTGPVSPLGIRWSVMRVKQRDDGGNDTGYIYVAIERADLAIWRLFLRALPMQYLMVSTMTAALQRCSLASVWLWVMLSRKR